MGVCVGELRKGERFEEFGGGRGCGVVGEEGVYGLDVWFFELEKMGLREGRGVVGL